MNRKAIIENVHKTISDCRQVSFAYLHGSFVTGSSFKDIDIAIHINPKSYEYLSQQGETTLGFIIPVERELENILPYPVDIQLLNAAPLTFRHRVIRSGKLIVDNDPNLRSDFEYLTRVEYFDFSPRRQEYLREALMG